MRSNLTETMRHVSLENVVSADVANTKSHNLKKILLLFSKKKHLFSSRNMKPLPAWQDQIT
mgnify:CR=1 FL=1